MVLVGLDGASWNVIDPMIAEGALPNLAAIAVSGVTADLETVEPVTSPVVWTSIATGRSPEQHGVTDFFSTAASISAPTVFERLAARGLRVGLYDYLMTWPPAPLPGGFVVPGWLRRDDAVWPPDLWERIDLAPWVNAYRPLQTSDDYRRNALEGARRKAPLWNALAARFDLEVGAVSFYGPDAMSHRFWHGAFPDEYPPEIAALADEAERSALRDVMRASDRAIGEIRARLGPDDSIVIVSDHGFETKPNPRSVWVGHFEDTLAGAGLDPQRDGFSVLTTFDRIVVRVHPGDFDARDATTTRLAALIDSQQTAGGEPLYGGAEVLDVAPRPAGRERSLANRARQWLIVRGLEWLYDVELDPSAHAVIFATPRKQVLEAAWPDGAVRVHGRDAKLSDLMSRQLFTGEHHPTAVFLAAGGPIARDPQRGRLSVLDVAPLLLYLAGSPVPDDLEGAVPVRWIDPRVLAARPVETAPAAAMPGIDRQAPGTPETTDPALLEKLRSLGYVE